MMWSPTLMAGSSDRRTTPTPPLTNLEREVEHEEQSALGDSVKMIKAYGSPTLNMGYAIFKAVSVRGHADSARGKAHEDAQRLFFLHPVPEVRIDRQDEGLHEYATMERLVVEIDGPGLVVHHGLTRYRKSLYRVQTGA